jgi:hypothetical protein
VANVKLVQAAVAYVCNDQKGAFLFQLNEFIIVIGILSYNPQPFSLDE